MDNLKIITQLTAIIQANVDKNFGKGRPPNNRSLEMVRQYAQEMLDAYMKEIIKESPELKKTWPFGHPFKVATRVSVQTRSYEIVITAKDEPKGT
jgi:hypothetical protein